LFLVGEDFADGYLPTPTRPNARFLARSWAQWTGFVAHKDKPQRSR
jgi:hypothetical protein